MGRKTGTFGCCETDTLEGWEMGTLRGKKTGTLGDWETRGKEKDTPELLEDGYTWR